MKIIDCDGLIVGRVASHVAEQVLLGKEISLVNCEEAILTGSRSDNLKKQKERSEMKGNPSQGRFYHRTADKFIHRTIQSMLPDNSRGKEALGRINCYEGVPEDFNEEDFETVEGAHIDKLPTLKYINVGEVCKTV